MKALTWMQYTTAPPTRDDLNYMGHFLLAFNVGTPHETWVTGEMLDLEGYEDPTTHWARLPSGVMV